MADTARLKLPLLAAAQAQKHVTHNEALTALDTLVQLSVLDKDLASPPASPAEGDCYIVAASASGAWTGWDGRIARYQDGQWRSFLPGEGWRAWVADEARDYVLSAGAWLPLARAGTAGLLFTPGATTFYRIDTSSGQNPRTALIQSISGDTITLTTSVASQFFTSAFMTDVSYARIWNTTKDPIEPAWVRAQPAANQLQVLSAASIAGWANGETIQIGDPETVTPNRCIALDISPMMQAILGQVFPQAGIVVKAALAAATANDFLDISPNGATGTFVKAARCYVAGGTGENATTVISCTEPSPVSNSNLVFIRESIATTAT
ncbi:uncharacterized protein DUF2793, partial [Tepidamorphus gemmatus]